MKKVLALVLAIAMLLSFAACGEKKEDPAVSEKQEQPAATIKMCMKSSATTALGQGVQKWIELVNAMEGVNLKLEFYPDAQLGNETEMAEQIMMGENMCLISDAGTLAQYAAPKLAALDGPFLTDDMYDYLTIANTDWFQARRAEYEAKGLYIPEVYFIFGQRHLICKNAVKTPADLKGKKIRSTSAPASIAVVEGLGATATPLAYADMYTSLSQGLIDGAENPLAALYSTKLYESAKYISLTGHQTTLSIFMMNKEVYDKLTDVQKDAFIKCGQQAQEYYNYEVLPKFTDDAIQSFKQENITIIEDVDKAAFREASLAVWDKLGLKEDHDLIVDQLAKLKK